MNIVVAGLGRLGMAIAQRLAEAGHSVTGWNRTPGRGEPLRSSGGQVADKLGDAVELSAVTVTCVADDDALLEVVLGDDGVGAYLPAAGVLVDCSTVSPQTSQRLATELGAQRFVAAPVLSNPIVTKAGNASLLLGGERDTIERLDWLWSDLAASYRYCGPPRAAGVCKLANNLLLVGGVALVAEAIGVVEAGGVEHKLLVEFLDDHPLIPAGIRNRLPRLIERDHAGWFDAGLSAKDVGLAADVAEAGGARVPVTRLVEQLMREAAAAHPGGDMTAVIELLGRRPPE
ncbi:MAG: hypothetical protein QOI86_5564 [Actinomycetota bacterium]|jgi:2-hydroxy-3-oxopropionate reductase|nr:hypothetical protein [Actinomycetota bacterium]